ncbi:MAG: hypothetical protein PHU32_06295 [Candidatus ainarchaeum sp.]|nr:hypothetical protein [Candidatus ainarchaeum sp.]
MGLKEIKNERKIEKNTEGNYIFEHVLIQEMGQSNVNALIESSKTDRESALNLIQNFDNVLSNTKNEVKKRLEEEKQKAQEFIESINEENKTEIALKLLEKTIETKQELVNNFEHYLDIQYKQIENFLLPSKINAKQKLDDAEKTLELWSEYYKEE